VGLVSGLDDLQLLDDRARPPMGDDQRQCVLVLGADVDEMNAQPVDLGHEVRQGVQVPLTLAPVVVGPPVPRELLHQRQPHALRIVGNRLLVGPAGRVYASAQLGELRLWETDLKRVDGVVFGRYVRLLTFAIRVAGVSTPWTARTSAIAPGTLAA
jgi:hypothetical protein